MQLVLMIQHLGHRCCKHSLTRPLGRIADLIIRLVWGASIPSEAEIAKTVHFGHNALAVVINRRAKIGDNCLIGTHVVIGGRAPRFGAPVIEANVEIHAGAKVLGPIRIGTGSIVAPNAVVIEDVPARCLVGGVPAKVIRTDVVPSHQRE